MARWLLLANAAIALTSPAWAQDLDAGRNEFLSKCATCHGADGKGDGPLGSKLKTKPPNLTISPSGTKACFPSAPFTRRFTTKGRGIAPRHRNADLGMPARGAACSAEIVPATSRPERQETLEPGTKAAEAAKSTGSHSRSACDPEPVIRSRILAVVEYLRKIQEK